MALHHGDARSRTGQPRTPSLRLCAPLVGMLLSGWALATLACLMLTDATMFLDVPLGAYLAGQGVFLSLIMIGVGLVGAGRNRP